jgi:hypothetical protein
MTVAQHHAQLLVEMGVSQTLCPGWPQTVIFPISAFQVARMKGRRHRCLAPFFKNIKTILKLFYMFS